MGWPFAIAAPTLDSDFITVPTSSTLVPTVAAAGTSAWLQGANFCNTTTGTITVTLTDGAGNKILNAYPIGPSLSVSFEWAFMPVTGLKWLASVTGLTGKAWGYV